MATGRLESALAALERALDDGLKAAKKVQSMLSAAHKATRSGRLRDIDKGLAGTLAASAELARTLDAVRTSWAFDADSYFSSGEYRAELMQAAKDSGLMLFDRDGRLACYPMLLSIATKDLAVMIDRKPERQVRPSVLVRLLLERQKRPQKFSAGAFLETVASAYVLLAPRLDPTWTPDTPGDGPSVQLADIHATLTLLPGSAREYSLAEFTRDVHLLDRAPATRTRDGRSFRLEASTGSRTGKRLTMVDADGREHLYVAIRLTRA